MTRPLAQILTRRLALIAAVIVVLNMGLVGVYYGTDRPELEDEVVSTVTEGLGAALDGNRLPPEAPARAIFAARWSRRGTPP